MRPLLLVVLLAACSTGPGPTCADCCGPSDPGPSPVTFGCRVLRADGGPAAGLQVRCLVTDAGTVTDSNGSFMMNDTVINCGIATGSFNCGKVIFTEDGGRVDVIVGGQSTLNHNARVFGGAGCTGTIP